MKMSERNTYAFGVKRRERLIKKLEDQKACAWAKLREAQRLQSLWPDLFGEDDNPNCVTTKWVRDSKGKYLLQVKVVYANDHIGLKNFTPDQVRPEFIPPNEHAIEHLLDQLIAECAKKVEEQLKEDPSLTPERAFDNITDEHPDLSGMWESTRNALEGDYNG